ncbi:MAG: hypothetical protein WCV00_20315 [Verrucomicrobiia bacterium]
MRTSSSSSIARREACRLFVAGAAAFAPITRFASAVDGKPTNGALVLCEVPPPPINYQPREGIFWDHWLHREPNGKYHLFYLYEPPGVPAADSRKAWRVGHATSRDLVKWEERKVALAPGKRWWVDRGIATGSVIEFGSRYAMLVTGYSHAGRVGLALAWSNDLENWTPVADKPVLEPSGEWYETPEQMHTNPPECAGFCDPYLVRKPGDTAVYAVLNTRVRDGAMYGRGSFALARSSDMVRWEMLPPLFVPGFITRCETPQVFTRGGRWYALASMWPKLMTEDFKQRHADKRYNAAALVWTADKFEGPYRLAGDWALFPNARCYICKVIEAPNGGDAILTIRITHKDGKMIAGLSPAYPVSYPPEGGIRIHYEKPLGSCPRS